MATGDDKGTTTEKLPEEDQLKARITGDRVRLEFLIEDLAKQLIIDRGKPGITGCNGCNSCS